MIVCHCRGVSDRAIRKAVREGAVDSADVARACGAGAHCGGCLDAVHEIVAVETMGREPRERGVGTGHDAAA